MPRLALIVVLVLSALASSRVALASCDLTPCVDAEPMWLEPSARRFVTINDTNTLPAAAVSGSLAVGFRLEPAVLAVPSPNRNGREINVLRHATDATVGVRAGLGRRLEGTLVLPAGLYQRGAGIKGITYQSAPPIPEQSLHDPRVGFAVALPPISDSAGLKLMLELKLPLGHRDALAGETSPVLSPAFVGSLQRGGIFGGAVLGARLRSPVRLFNTRIGTQALVAMGCGYELPQPLLAFAIEAYAAPSIVESELAYVPAEWLASVSFRPRALPQLALGAASGSGIPLVREPNGNQLISAFGVPSWRSLLFVRFDASRQ